jgi:hypothetical protein
MVSFLSDRRMDTELYLFLSTIDFTVFASAAAAASTIAGAGWQRGGESGGGGAVAAVFGDGP